MPVLTKESLKERLGELSSLYLENRLYEVLHKLDYIMLSYFDMKKMIRNFDLPMLDIKRNQIMNKDSYLGGVTPTEKPYKPVPICTCQKYQKNNSGLVTIFKVGSTPKVIVPSFNRLYWTWYFYGPVWNPENPKQKNDIGMPCVFMDTPSSIDTFYKPERPLTYILENFERIQADKPKGQIPERKSLLTGIRSMLNI